jgi:hypothetical protein
MEVRGQLHSSAALYSRGNSPRYSLYRRLGGPRDDLDVMVKRGLSIVQPVA